MRWFVAAAFAAAALLMVAPARAQSVTPTAAIEIGLDPGPVGIPLGGSHEFPFQVTLTLANVACTQAAMATVALSINDLPSPLRGVEGTVPATLSFAVPMGNYASGIPGTNPYSETLDAMLSINVTSEALADHEHTFEVTGAFDGTLQGCQGAGAIPTAEGTGQHAIKTGPAPAAGQVRGAQSLSSTTAPSDGKDASALPFALLGALVLAVAALRRP